MIQKPTRKKEKLSTNFILSRKPLSFPPSSKKKCMKKNEKKEGELQKKLKYSKATRRKRDSNETRISLPENCIKNQNFRQKQYP